MGDCNTKRETVFRTMSELWQKRLTLVKYLWREGEKDPSEEYAQIQRGSRDASIDAGEKEGAGKNYSSHGMSVGWKR